MAPFHNIALVSEQCAWHLLIRKILCYYVVELWLRRHSAAPQRILAWVLGSVLTEVGSSSRLHLFLDKLWQGLETLDMLSLELLLRVMPCMQCCFLVCVGSSSGTLLSNPVLIRNIFLLCSQGHIQAILFLRIGVTQKWQYTSQYFTPTPLPTFVPLLVGHDGITKLVLTCVACALAVVGDVIGV